MKKKLKKPRPTIRQKKAAIKTFEEYGKKKPMSIGAILIDSGYPETTAHGRPSSVTDSAGYKETLKKLLERTKIDKNSRLERLAEIFYDDDKRSALGAGDQITKILGEYKENKTKAIALFEKIEQLED
jgi:hypothetical protein